MVKTKGEGKQCSPSSAASPIVPLATNTNRGPKVAALFVSPDYLWTSSISTSSFMLTHTN